MEEVERRQEQGEHPGEDKGFFVVGLGASAGGIGALKQFFSGMPKDSGMAFVVVLHLSQTHESHLAEILQTTTEMTVLQVRETVKVEPNHVYVIPPAKHLAMLDGEIRLQEPRRVRGKRVPIDLFFRSLGEAYGKNSIAVILSGTGSDGTLGLKRVKENGGIVLAQSPDEAEYNEMPRNAINTNLVDVVLPVAEMPEKIVAMSKTAEKLEPQVKTSETEDEPANVEEKVEITEAKAETPPDALREVLTLLKVRTGHDFYNYKRPTLLRRIARRLQVHELADISSYLQLLREQPEEVEALLRDLLISVTNFFRDKDAFAALELEVIPRLFTNKTSNDTVRVWSCGCATGEEAYSLAMLLSEYAAKQPDAPKIQVFASDINEEAIRAAREGRYDETLTADVSTERLSRFFMKDGDLYRVKKEIRDLVLFAPHNVLRDPPFSRLDLITCRNLLIYLNRETQDKILELFHFALRPSGHLFLGASETAENLPSLYSVVDKKQHIYHYRPGPTAYAALPNLPATGKWEVKHPEIRALEPSTFGDLHFRLVERLAPPSVLVDEGYKVLHVSENAGRFLQIAGGTPTHDLLKIVRPGLKLELQSALLEAQRRGVSEARDVRFRANGHETLVNITAHLVKATDTESAFYLVIFDESKRSVAPLVETESSELASIDLANRETMEGVVRHLEEDLSRTHDRLQASVEQYETSIEELRASNEELQAMNEELHSASEELQTSKEELQSVNEELTTVNHELKDRVDELSRANSDLQNLMAATDIGTMFLDRSLNIKRYTPPLRDLFNIIPSDIGRPLSHLTHRLEHHRLPDDALEVLETLRTLEREVKSTSGNHYLMRVAPYRTSDDRIDGVVVSFVDVSEARRGTEALRESEEKFRTLFDSIDEGLCIIEMINDETSQGVDFRYLELNQAWGRLTGLENVVGRLGSEVLPNNESYWLETFDKVAQTGESLRFENYNDDTGRWYSAYISRVGDAGSRRVAIVFDDVTERKRTEANLAFLAEVSDDLVHLTNIDETMNRLGEKIGRFFGVTWCMFAEHTNAFQTSVASYGWNAEDVLSLKGTYRLRDFLSDKFMDMLLTGEPLIVSETQTDMRVSAEHYGALGIRSFIAVPLVREGEWRFQIFIMDNKPRVWREDEVGLMRELTGRIWTRLERARAEEALAKSEEKYRTLFDSMDEGYCIIEVLFDSDDQAVDYRFLTMNSAFERQTGIVGGTGKRMLELAPQHERFWFETYGHIALTGEAQRFEHEAAALGRFYDVYAYRIGAATERRVAVLFNDITEHKRTEANATLLDEVSQDLAKLTNIDETMNALGEKIAAHLGLSAVAFAELDETTATAFINYGWHRSDVPSLLGTYRMEEFMTPEVVQDCRAGKAVIIRDVFKDPRTDGEGYAAINIGSFVSIPLVRGGVWRFLLVVYRSEPYDWRDDEIALVRELANRIWTRLERARTEETLQKSEAQLGALVANLPGGAAFIVDHDFRYVLAEGEALSGAGFRSEDFLGKTIFEVLSPELATYYEPLYRAALAGKTFEHEHDSHGMSYISHGVPLRKTEGDIYAVLVVSYDITGRKRAENALRRSEAQFRELANSMPQIVLQSDARGKLVFFNERWLKYTGMTPERSLKEGVWPAVYPDDVEADKARWEKAVATGERYESEYRLRRNDGVYRWHLERAVPVRDGEGNILHWFHASTDIDDFKRVQKALHTVEERQRLLIESAKDFAIFTIDTDPDRSVTSWNSGAERIFGYSEAEIIGASADLLFTPEDREKGDPEREVETARLKGRAGNERWHIRKNGSRFYGSGAVTPLLNHDGTLLGFVKIMRDLTEQKQMTEALQASEQALREADKRKDEFLAVLAHELRNPLAPIRTSLEIMKRTKNKEADEEARAIIERQTNQIVHLVDDLLDISRITRGKIKLQKERVTLSEIISVAVESSQPVIEAKQHELSISLPSDAIELYGDKTRLAQVFLNLLNNAAKYTNPGGRISLAAKVEKDQVAVRVTDNGLGIPSEKLSELFDLFTRLERDISQEGLGIGLNLVKQLVEMHGGMVEAYSAGLNQGSEFTVRLPTVSEGESLPAPEKVSDTTAQPKKDASPRRVLVVDDYEANRKTLVRMLRLMGHEVTGVSNGQEALELLEAFTPDLILLDINMPGMSGYEVAQRIRGKRGYEAMKLVALTGYGSEDDLRKAKEAGFHHHLVKPVDVKVLDELLSTPTMMN